MEFGCQYAKNALLVQQINKPLGLYWPVLKNKKYLKNNKFLHRWKDFYKRSAFVDFHHVQCSPALASVVSPCKA